CLCVSAKEMDSADNLVAKIKKRMDQAWELDDISVFIQVNLAVINTPHQVVNREEFKQATDLLFMEMKTERKKSVIVYTRSESLDQQQRLNIITALRNSIRHPLQVQAYYQPIFEIDTGRMVAAEALMRIDDKHLGLLQPSDFIDVAEKTALIVPLRQILLTQVCHMLKMVPEDAVGYIAVNLSGKDFEAQDIGKTLLETIKSEGVDPKRIGFEITESVVLQSYEAVADVMKKLSRENISFALDDFGTGYSNMQALMDLPYHFVKFDRSVIQRSVANPKMLSLVTDMLHKMDKSIIAEGVESEQELAMIRHLGIGRVQGYYFAKPMDSKAFHAFVTKPREP
ncbi:MAG TPA: EAL domain-containing protein, partial [Sphaerochaeta sp.]|nr:EAL domain-containing protein [Sphaerochaeta sp.]